LAKIVDPDIESPSISAIYPHRIYFEYFFKLFRAIKINKRM